MKPVAVATQLRAPILEALAPGPLSAAQLAARLGHKHVHVRDGLRQIHDEGLVQLSPHRRTWRLPSASPWWTRD